MSRTIRQFVDQDAAEVHSRMPLIIGITGASSSGKTYSSLRLATGIQRVLGGDIWGIDTEAKRMLHYKPYFKFRWMDFRAPFSALDYKDAIDHCVSKGAKTIIIDSMTHEHDGEGGLLDQIEKYMDRKAGDDWAKREKYKWAAMIAPKRERVELRNRIIELSDVVFILCYQAAEKTKPNSKGGADVMGWQPITTSKLPYDMTARFLLTPGCEGVPILMPELGAERMLTKNPRQFKDWFKEGEPLSEDMGARMAEWSVNTQKMKKPEPPAPEDLRALTAAYTDCETKDTFMQLETQRKQLGDIPKSDASQQLKAAREAAMKRIQQPTTDTGAM